MGNPQYIHKDLHKQTTWLKNKSVNLSGIFWSNCALLTFNSILCWAFGPLQIVPKQTVALVYAIVAPECLTLTNCLLQCKWWHMETLHHDPKLHTSGRCWGCLMNSAKGLQCMECMDTFHHPYCCIRAGRKMWQPALPSNTSNSQSCVLSMRFIRNTDFPEKFSEQMIVPKVPGKCLLADCSPLTPLCPAVPLQSLLFQS